MASPNDVYISGLNNGVVSNSNNLQQIITDTNTGYAGAYPPSGTTIYGITDRMNQEILAANVNQEILLKQQQLLALKNAKLNGQLIALDDLEGTIINKDNLVKETEKDLKKKNNNINLLIFIMIIALLAFGLIGLSYMGSIDKDKMTKGLMVLALIAIIGYIYYADLFYLKTAFSTIFFNREQVMIDKLNNWEPGKNVINAIDTQIFGTEADWQKENCNSCKVPQEEAEDVGIIPYGELVQSNPGYFYYDGTAPPQQLYPSPTYANDPTKEGIFWPDYDSNDERENKMPTFYTTENNNTSADHPDGTSSIDNHLTGSYTLTTNI